MDMNATKAPAKRAKIRHWPAHRMSDRGGPHARQPRHPRARQKICAVVVAIIAMIVSLVSTKHQLVVCLVRTLIIIIDGINVICAAAVTRTTRRKERRGRAATDAHADRRPRPRRSGG